MKITHLRYYNFLLKRIANHFFIKAKKYGGDLHKKNCDF